MRLVRIVLCLSKSEDFRRFFKRDSVILNILLGLRIVPFKIITKENKHSFPCLNPKNVD